MSTAPNRDSTSLREIFQTTVVPVIPEVAQALIQTLSEDKVVISRVRDLIAKDSAITGKVMRAANAAVMGLPRKIATLDEAIALIGSSQARTVALAACMNVSFPEIPGMSRAGFWQRTMKCSSYAQWLASESGIDPQEAWLAGMMFRLGKIIILRNSKDVQHLMQAAAQTPYDRWRLEQEMLGFTEADVAAELTRRWFFPSWIVNAIKYAADPAKAAQFDRMSGTVHLGALLAEMPSTSADAIDQLPANVMMLMELDAEDLRKSLPAEDSFLDLTAI